MQHAEEAATETETHRFGDFGLEAQRRVVEAQFFQRFAQRRVILRVDREQAGEHARLHLLETRAAARPPAARRDVSVSPTGAPCTSLIDALTQPTSPAPSFARSAALGREHADLVDQVRAPGRHHQDLVARLDLALHHAHQRHDAEVIVEPRIDDQRLQAVARAALGGGMRTTIASSTSTTFRPVLALMATRLRHRCR